MHRFLAAFVQYFVELGRSAIRGWDRFFFTPTDPIIVGLLRVCLGSLLFWDMAVLGLDLHDYLGSDGWISIEAVRSYLVEWAPGAWSFWLYVPDRWLTVVWALCLVVIALFTVGYASRLTAVLAWTITISTVRRAPVALFGFDYMIATWTFYLAAFGASGQALSLDRLLRRCRYRSTAGNPAAVHEKPAASILANITVRMIQLHLCLIYGSAGLSKLMSMEWWNGTAMEMLILTPEFRRIDLVWLTAYPLLLNLATHCGLFLEITYPVLVWNAKLRPLVIALAIVLHLGIDLLLGLTEFGLAMITANLVFCSGAWLRQLAAHSREPSRAESLAVASSRDPLVTRRSGGRQPLEPKGAAHPGALAALVD